MPALKHLHTYEKDPIFKDHFRCIHPDCTHHNHRLKIMGKRAMCRCGAEFVLPGNNGGDKPYNYKNLVCDNCSNTKQARERRASAKLVQSALVEMAIGFNPDASMELTFGDSLEIKSDESILEPLPTEPEPEQGSGKSEESVLDLLNRE